MNANILPTKSTNNQKIPNFIGWAAIILTADRMGFKAYYTDIASRILDTLTPPDAVFSADLENEALRLNRVIAANQMIEEANKIALKFVTHDWGGGR
jgi:hypothetical protein